MMEYDLQFEECPHGNVYDINKLYGYEAWLNSFRYQEKSLEQKRTQLLTSIVDFLNNLDKPMRVVVAGSFNSGKSTFLNALMGQELMPVGVLRATGTANYLQASDKKEFTIIRHNAALEVRQYNENEALCKEIKRLMNDEQELINRIEIGCPDVDFLKTFTLIDTPGLNHNDLDTEISEREVARADVLIWVLFDKGSENIDKESILHFHQTHPECPIIIILNQIDDLETEDDLSDALQKVEKDFADICCKVFPISAKQAMQGGYEKNHQKVVESRFCDLHNYIHNVIFNSFWDLQKNIRLKQKSKDLLDRSKQFKSNHNKELEMAPENITDEIQQGHARYIDEKEFINQQLEKNLKINTDSQNFYESTAIKGLLVNILKHTHGLLCIDEQWSQAEKNDLWAQINRISKAKFRIGVFGSFSSGKSTLINTLLGEQCLLPVDEGPCTSVYTVIKKIDATNPTGSIKIDWKSLEELVEKLQDNLQSLSGDSLGELPEFQNTKQLVNWISKHKPRFDQLYKNFEDNSDWIWETDETKKALHQEIIALLKAVPCYKKLKNKYRHHDGQLNQLMADKMAACMVRSLVFYLDHPLLQHAEIIDSPGSGSVNLTDTMNARKLVKESDALLFLTEASMPLCKQEEMLFLKHIVEHVSSNEQIFFVATKTDLSKKAPEEIEKKITDTLSRVFKREEDDLKIYSISCDTGLNVQKFMASLNCFLQEGKDKNFLTIVQKNTKTALTNILKNYEYQLTQKQSDIQEIEEKIETFSRKKKNLERFWGSLINDEYKSISEGTYTIDLLTPYNSQRGKLEEKIVRSMESSNRDTGLEKAKNHINVHIKHIVKPCIELALEGVDKNLAEIDQTVQEILDDQIDTLYRAYNVTSVMKTIASDALYEKSFDELLASEVSSILINVLKNISNAQIRTGEIINTLGRNIKTKWEKYFNNAGEFISDLFFKDILKTNPMIFGENVEDAKNIRQQNKQRIKDKNDELDSQRLKGSYAENKLRNIMVNTLISTTDNIFIGKPNISNDESIIFIVKREFSTRLITYVEEIKADKHKAFKEVLENIQQSLEQQKNDLKKSNSEKEILSKNRIHIKEEIEFLKKESQEVMKRIESIY